MNYCKCAWCNENDVYTIGKNYLSKDLQKIMHLESQYILSCNKCNKFSLLSKDKCDICNKIWINIYKISHGNDIKLINEDIKKCIDCYNKF